MMEIADAAADDIITEVSCLRMPNTGR